MIIKAAEKDTEKICTLNSGKKATSRPSEPTPRYAAASATI